MGMTQPSSGRGERSRSIVVSSSIAMVVVVVAPVSKQCSLFDFTIPLFINRSVGESLVSALEHPETGLLVGGVVFPLLKFSEGLVDAVLA